MNKEREKLVEELKTKKWAINNITHIADFILEDRKRIVEPLTEIAGHTISCDANGINRLLRAYVETLKRGNGDE